ncbi:MAG: chromosome segregation protein SMC [Hyphomicrobiales bacterium]|nr:chromosome segregation protein SMC [Hyphomicrobiales bacterium]MDE2113644.1 chromosome segregation protein SMC [Hyphomicrobiales bacterium]
MKFHKLRLAGFKSFVDASDFWIEPGLTGVVGPNGCGKSNLVEALRWVMGENSYKNMRASGMDDVIFSGSAKRPARNIAEVVIVLDNSARTAPAAFNSTDQIEVSRRITREEGSSYKINGREVRARDVQLLFADASSGARSPAMVRQGQIGEIINAKPPARRRILEEAAGVSGLHSRRHEAELRLKAAEANLLRLEDVLNQFGTQIDSLRRQARQAERYRGLGEEIRKAEMVSYCLQWQETLGQASEAERAVNDNLRRVAELTVAQNEAARLQAIAAHEMQPLRDTEAQNLAQVQRLVLEREALDGEEQRQKLRIAELEQRARQMAEDANRERARIEDARNMLARLAAESQNIEAANLGAAATHAQAKAEVEAATAALAIAEAEHDKAQSALADLTARRRSLETRARDELAHLTRLTAETTQVQAEWTQLNTRIGSEAEIDALQASVQQAKLQQQQCEAAVLVAEQQLTLARRDESALRGPASEAERNAQRIDTELRTLQKLLASPLNARFTPIVDQLQVTPGFEIALVAALGDDLDACAEAAAPVHWRETQVEADAADPALPEGALPMADKVRAPRALLRRLNQIGIVSRDQGASLQLQLKPGQRLVSREGDLWRWDGFCAAAEAPSPAARRLAERNRLAQLSEQAQLAAQMARAAQTALAQASGASRNASQTEAQSRSAHREAARLLDGAREKLSQAERQRAQHAGRLAALAEARNRLTLAKTEAATRAKQAQQELTALSQTTGEAEQLGQAHALARAQLAQNRASLSQAQGHLQALTHEAAQRAARQITLQKDLADWRERQTKATASAAEFARRALELQTELDETAAAPDAFLLRRRALMQAIDTAQEQLKSTGDARALGEARLAQADRHARKALEEMSAAREEAARAGANFEARQARRDELLTTIQTELDMTPATLFAQTGFKPGGPLPDREALERKLEGLRADRDRLGAVNLRANLELDEMETAKTALAAERDDLIEAIKRLRQAIANLNREGRERLQAAFDVINGHFRDLFTTLFGGGTAELQLIESEDPLAAGLEIFARPPGKKPQTMSLLSGGEQALTAMALIFAVFLTNPSPICVLDEVDAPLDDANVERFCDLLVAMRQRTDTRFLTITHNPITMARMDRLFGVTMAEQGVSQLVSVDLSEAEQLAEAS